MTVGPSIDDETLSYVRRVRTANGQEESQRAITIFKKAFYEWGPSSVACIKSCDKATLEIIFYPSERLDMSMRLNHGMVEFQKYIANLVSEWNELMNDKVDDLKFGDLQHLLDAMESSTWDSYMNFYKSKDRVNDRRYMYLIGCALPDLISIQTQVQGIQLHNDTRRNFLVVSIHGQMYNNIEMLHTYKWFANTDTLSLFQVHDSKALQSMSKFSLETDLFDISTIYGIAENDQHRLCDWLYMCAFFYKYPSALFGPMKYKGSSASNTTFATISGNTTNSGTDHTTMTDLSGYWPNIHSFVKAAAEKRFEIQQLFSDNMSYSSVAAVLQTTLTNDAIIESEFKVLMNCDKLHLSASDVTKFRMVKLLYDYSQPLIVFVETCIRHTFCLVNTGETFQSLQAAVVNFYSFPDDRNRDDCIRFFDRLYLIFCPKIGIASSVPNAETDTRTVPPYSEYLTALHKIDDLTRV